MLVYIVLFVLSVALGIPLVSRSPSKAKKAVYVGIMFVLMYVVSVFRHGIGNDYFSYIRIFNEISGADFGGIFALGYEPLFAVIVKLISFATIDPEIVYAIYALLILTPVALAIWRWSDNAWLSVTAYLCLTLFYNSLSFIRQSMAVSLLILAYGFIKEKKVVPVLIFGIAAVLLHYTAAIFIPLYLLSLVRPTKKYLIIYGSVSVGALITCLIMKAVGANPLNLLAQLVTAVTGKNYLSYIDSSWFETGFGPEYLIMPLGLLAVVLISYFCGWKERPEADTLLQFTLMSASIWSFIIYAFIVERFSMFVFVFTIFTIPSITEYFAEKAREIEEKEKEKPSDKKMPGYSKKKAEEKKDSSFLLTVGITLGLFIYNCFGMVKNFHGVFPYVCMFPEIEDAFDGLDTPQKNRNAIYTNGDLYTFLIQLKNADCGYIAVSSGHRFGYLGSAVRRADEYAGTGLCDFFLDPSQSGNWSALYKLYDGTAGEARRLHLKDLEVGGITVTNDDGLPRVTDPQGLTARVKKDMLTFFMLDENNNIFDATQFSVAIPKRSAIKLGAEPEEPEETGETQAVPAQQ